MAYQTYLWKLGDTNRGGFHTSFCKPVAQRELVSILSRGEVRSYKKWIRQGHYPIHLYRVETDEDIGHLPDDILHFLAVLAYDGKPKDKKKAQEILDRYKELTGIEVEL